MIVTASAPAMPASLMTRVVSRGPSMLIQEIPAFRPSKPPRNALRREVGKHHLAACLIYLLAQNEWSHPDLQVIGQWALNEPNAIHTSQISHIRNGRMRMVGLKTMDALGAINLAVWAYNNDRDLLKNLGSGVVTSNIEHLITGKVSLIDPTTELPLDQGAWMNLYLGYIQIPEVVGGIQRADCYDLASQRLGEYVAQVIANSSYNMLQARDRLADTLPPTIVGKLMAASAGIENYPPEDLVSDANDICVGLKRIDGKNRTANSLFTELDAL